jgi:M6 family metalloprotease-like protein
MKNRTLVVATLIAIFTNFLAPTFAAPQLSNCLLGASSTQVISLGTPVARERLAYKSNIRIGVLPFYFTDSSNREMTKLEKSDYLTSASLIEKISNNQVKVEIIFLPQVSSNMSILDFKNFYLNRDNSWSNKSLDKSTWGFVRNLIKNSDSAIDYANLDTVILEGSNPDKSFTIAEAMDYFTSSEGNNYYLASEEFFKSIKTAEGYVSNAVLLDKHVGPNTIVHEIFHNFGLTDLYGSGTGPGKLSIMSVGEMRLLNYEQALLGWFPVDQIRCFDLSTMVDFNKVSADLLIADYRKDSINLIKINDESAYIIEVIQYENKSLAVLYLLEQNQRPPITVFSDPKISYMSFFDISDPKTIGSYYKTIDFNMLVANQIDSSALIKLIPKSLANSSEGLKVISDSLEIRAEAISKLEAKARAEAEAKARAEAEAKAKAPALKTTINCLKGKTVKKITAVNPKCPSGYKRK